MNETTWQQWAITITTFLPIAGAIVVLLVPSSKDKMIRGLGVVTTALAFACSIAIAIGFDYGRSAELQFVKDVSWIPVIGARYHVGIDGISMPLFVLTYLLGLLCAIYTARYVPQPGRTKAFVALTLAADHRDGGHVHLVRPDLVLRLLGAGAGPDVLPDRDLGIGEPAVREHQVLPVHAVRVGVHAAGVPGAVLHRERPRHPPAHVRPPGDHRLRCTPAGSRTRSSSSCSGRSRWGSP